MASKVFVIIALFLGSFLYESIPFVFAQKDSLTFYDVGQGDAIHLRTKNNFDILIDAGPSDAVSQKLAENMPWTDRDLDIIIATHFDADHITGFLDILEKYHVGLAILNRTDSDTSLGANFIKKLHEQGTEIKIVQPNESLELSNGIRLNFFNATLDAEFSDNENSLSVRLVAGSQTFMLTGDMEKGGEAKAVKQKVFLKSRVLKAGHHGSKSSTTTDFLKAVSPQEVVLSYGKDNKYGHPAAEVATRLETARIPTRKTAEQGDIRYHLKKQP